MFTASTSIHAPIVQAVALGSTSAPLKIVADKHVAGVLQGSGDVCFFLGDRPEDRTLATNLAAGINATIADHKRTVDRAMMLHSTAETIRVSFDDVSIPGVFGIASFELVVQATDAENWLSVDVLSGEGPPRTWTSVASIDLRNVFFGHADAERARVEAAILEHFSADGEIAPIPLITVKVAEIGELRAFDVAAE